MRRLAMMVLLSQITASAGLLFLSNGTESTCTQGSGRVRWLPGDAFEREWVPLESKIMPHEAAKTDFSSLHSPSLDNLRILNSLPFVDLSRFTLRMTRETVQLEIRSSVEDLYFTFRGADGNLDAEPFLCPFYCRSETLTLTHLGDRVQAKLDSQTRTVRVNSSNIVQFHPADAALVRVVEVPYLAIRDTAYTTRHQLQLSVSSPEGHLCLTHWRRSSIAPHANVGIAGQTIALRSYGADWRETRLSNMPMGTHNMSVNIFSSPTFDTPPRFSFVLLLSTVCQSDAVRMSAPSAGCSASLQSTHVPDSLDSVCRRKAGQFTACACPECRICSEVECGCDLRPIDHPPCAATDLEVSSGETTTASPTTTTPAPTTTTPTPTTTTSVPTTTPATTTSTTAPASTPTKTTWPAPPTTTTSATTTTTTTTAASPTTTAAIHSSTLPTSGAETPAPTGIFDKDQLEAHLLTTLPPTWQPPLFTDSEVVPDEMERVPIQHTASLDMSGSYALVSIAGGAALAFSLGAILKIRCSVRPWVQALICHCRREEQEDYDVELANQSIDKKGKSEEPTRFKSEKGRTNEPKPSADRPAASRAAKDRAATPPPTPTSDYIYGTTPPSMAHNELDLEEPQSKAAGSGRPAKGRRAAKRASTRPASTAGGRR